jgi:thiol-disulfide isomerase/thioredoxin
MQILPIFQLLNLEDYPLVSLDLEQSIDARLQRIFDQLAIKHNYTLLYVGGSWCAPCKALRPVLQNHLRQFPNLASYEIELAEDADYGQSRWLRSLPGVLLIKSVRERNDSEGRVIAQINGLVDSATIQILLDQARGNQIPLDINDNDKHAYVTSTQELIRTLTEQGFLAAAEAYKSLGSGIKYQPQLQQVKSLIELVRIASTKLQQADLAEDVVLVYQYYLQQDVASGLAALLRVLRDESPKSARISELKSLYVLALNTLEDKGKARYFRQAYQSVL